MSLHMHDTRERERDVLYMHDKRDMSLFMYDNSERDMSLYK